jgi:SNF2 family DNA or RNA helicase
MTAAENDQYEAKALLAARSIRAKLSKLPDAQKRISALDLLRQLRESAAHPALVDDNAGDRSSKVDWLVEQLECDARNGEQSLVFSQWTRVLDRIARVLVDSGIAHARLDGSMPNSVRKRACADLNQGRVAVLLLTIGAGGVGLNLQSASRVYVYDPWWNPQKEIQAICRAHRQGQQKPVVAIHLIAQDTVEERIVALQQKKMDIFDAVMEGAERGGGLTTAQLIELIAPAAMEL